MEFALAPLIGEARARQRLRRRAIWVAVLAAIAAAGVFVLTRPPSGASPGALYSRALGAPPGTVLRSPGELFSQLPYMGVRCGVANWIGCDSVGLAVWLRHPADAVRATIAGRAFPLSQWGDERGAAIPRRDFDGRLWHAGITTRIGVRSAGGYWDGSGTPSPVVEVLVEQRPGHYYVTRLRVPLMAGWG